MVDRHGRLYFVPWVRMVMEAEERRVGTETVVRARARRRAAAAAAAAAADEERRSC